MSQNLKRMVTVRILIIAAIAVSASGAPAEHSLEKLPACQAASASAPERWKVIGGPHEQMRFRIPPGMQEVRDPNLFCMHGCEEWARGTFRVLVAHGIWAPVSFDDQSWATACVEKRGALRVVLMRSDEGRKHEVVAWPVNDTATQTEHDVLLNVQWSDRADAADAQKVIASVR